MDVAKPIYIAKQRRARAEWLFELGPLTLIFAAIVIASVTSLLYLTQASRVAATGYDIGDLDEQRSQLQRQQQMLLVKEAELQSLDVIEAQATNKLGMQPAVDTDFVKVKPPPLDVDQALQRALVAAQHRPPTWWQRLRDSVMWR
jgi:cell division protein FtsL